MLQTNQDKLDDIYEMVEENNNILKNLLRREKIASFFKIAYWLIILGGLFGIYYYIQPYLDVVKNNSGLLKDFFDKLNIVSNPMQEINGIKNILNTINSIKN